MSGQCSDSLICKDGQCVGCKDGKPWCQDPRCFPYCPEEQCIYPGESHDYNGNMVMLVIICCLLTALIIMWFIYGPEFFTPHDSYVIVKEYKTTTMPLLDGRL